MTPTAQMSVAGSTRMVLWPASIAFTTSGEAYLSE